MVQSEEASLVLVRSLFSLKLRLELVDPCKVVSLLLVDVVLVRPLAVLKLRQKQLFRVLSLTLATRIHHRHYLFGVELSLFCELLDEFLVHSEVRVRVDLLEVVHCTG